MKIQKINELLTFIVLELHIFLYFMHSAHNTDYLITLILLKI